jgi:hypothetical protein
MAGQALAAARMLHPRLREELPERNAGIRVGRAGGGRQCRLRTTARVHRGRRPGEPSRAAVRARQDQAGAGPGLRHDPRRGIGGRGGPVAPGGESLLRGPPAPTAAPARGSSRIWDPVLRDKPMLFLLAAAMRATARRTSRSVARPCAAAQMQTSTQATRSVPAAVFQALSPPPRARSTPATAMDPAMAVHMASRGLAGVRRRFTVRGFRGGGV